MTLSGFFKTEVPRFAIKVFAVVWVLYMVAASLVTYFSPRIFCSNVHVHCAALDAASPYAAQRHESKLMLSKPILTQVVGELNLCEVWGQKFFKGETIRTNEALLILVNRLRITRGKDKSTLTINAYSDIPQEAALVANTVAKIYRQVRNADAPPVSADASPAAKASAELVQILDEAQPASRPCKPNVPFNLIVGVFSATSVGLFAAILVVLLHRFIKSPRFVKPPPLSPSVPAMGTTYTDTPIEPKY